MQPDSKFPAMDAKVKMCLETLNPKPFQIPCNACEGQDVPRNLA